MMVVGVVQGLWVCLIAGGCWSGLLVGMVSGCCGSPLVFCVVVCCGCVTAFNCTYFVDVWTLLSTLRSRDFCPKSRYYFFLYITW